MENRIKEQQLDLFADRTSCHGWWANQWRLLRSAAAYTLLEGLRRLTARLPTAVGKSLDLIVAASPYLIEALRLLKRRYYRRRQQLAHRPKPNAAGENHEPPGDDLPAQPPGTLPRHPPAQTDPPTEPARQPLPDKRSS